jgi:hypothetical protein
MVYSTVQSVHTRQILALVMSQTLQPFMYGFINHCGGATTLEFRETIENSPTMATHSNTPPPRPL